MTKGLGTLSAEHFSKIMRGGRTLSIECRVNQ